MQMQSNCHLFNTNHHDLHRLKPIHTYQVQSIEATMDGPAFAADVDTLPQCLLIFETKLS